MTMRRSGAAAVMCAACAGLPLALGPAVAQGLASTPSSFSYPTKPVRFIVVFPPGGSVDAVARIVAQRLGVALGQQVVIDNRSGAGGLVGTEIAAKAAPDGFTLAMVSNAYVTYPSLYRKLSFDPMRDFEPITVIGSAPLLLAVSPSLPVKSVAELVAMAKTQPGKLSYASSGNGTSSHMAAELFKSLAAVDMVHIPYKGAAQALTDLIAGQPQLMFSSTLAFIPQVKAGKLRGLGVTSARRIAAIPDIPAIAESVPGYELSPWYGVIAPAGTPKPIIARLHTAIVEVLALPDVQEIYQRQGAEPVHMRPEQFAVFLKSEMQKWTDLVKLTGARVD
jgi:tripartite-type tricarboxylate transporter receptor subunit TctC